MELRDAIDQISTIRTQLAATEHLRSLRSVPVALSGLLALLAAVAQAQWLGDPMLDPGDYLTLWVGSAVLSGIVATVVVLRRAQRCPSALSVANARLAATQFAPSLLVGAVVTWFVADRLPHELWLLPGLWQLLFGLGNLAAHRLLPGPAIAVGLMFLASGTCCLWFGERALDPWAMGLPFAFGQLSLAAILWWHHERSEMQQELCA
ncbi:MAG TPA: hypothetical protein VFZ65_04405 [Planctomycetota bacterium]|nr:hypothetical protein [Planctomycetota bacterium]